MLTQDDVGKNITVKYAADESGSSNPMRVLNVNDPPTDTLSINGMPIPGKVLNVINTLNDIDGLGAFKY
jgi:hypothetical protein